MQTFLLVFDSLTIVSDLKPVKVIGDAYMLQSAPTVEWPALAKLGLDVASNLFLSFAFLSVIRRHYRMFGNNMHKILFSNSMIFS